MKHQLSGKITWIPFDSQFIGRTTFKEMDDAIVAKLEYFIRDSNIIKFSTFATEELKGEDWHFDINLVNQNDVFYTGTYSHLDRPEIKGRIDCELFENRNEILLIGKWYEEITYTFWAKIQKKK